MGPVDVASSAPVRAANIAAWFIFSPDVLPKAVAKPAPAGTAAVDSCAPSNASRAEVASQRSAPAAGAAASGCCRACSSVPLSPRTRARMLGSSQPAHARRQHTSSSAVQGPPLASRVSVSHGARRCAAARASCSEAVRAAATAAHVPRTAAGGRAAGSRRRHAPMTSRRGSPSPSQAAVPASSSPAIAPSSVHVPRFSALRSSAAKATSYLVPGARGKQRGPQGPHGCRGSSSSPRSAPSAAAAAVGFSDSRVRGALPATRTGSAALYIHTGKHACMRVPLHACKSRSASALEAPGAPLRLAPDNGCRERAGCLHMHSRYSPLRHRYADSPHAHGENSPYRSAGARSAAAHRTPHNATKTCSQPCVEADAAMHAGGLGN